MITPADLWLAYMAGFAGGTLLPLVAMLVRVWRARRAEEVERRHWKALSKFCG